MVANFRNLVICSIVMFALAAHAERLSCVDVWTKSLEPSYETTKIDNEALENWLSNLPRRYKLAGTFLAENFQLLTMEEFFRRLDQAVETFLSSVEAPHQTAFLFETGRVRAKSGEWLTGRLLSQHPQFNQANAYSNSSLTELQANLKAGRLKTVAIIDDAMYSGSQIHHLVSSLLRGYEGPPIQIHVVTPFSTNYAKERLQELATGESVESLTVVSKVEIPTLDELVVKSKNPKLLQSFYDAYGLNGYNAMRRKTLTYFEHKVPDQKSAVPEFTLGQINVDGQITTIPFILKGSEPYRRVEVQTP